MSCANNVDKHQVKWREKFLRQTRAVKDSMHWPLQTIEGRIDGRLFSQIGFMIGLHIELGRFDIQRDNVGAKFHDLFAGGFAHSR